MTNTRKNAIEVGKNRLLNKKMIASCVVNCFVSFRYGNTLSSMFDLTERVFLFDILVFRHTLFFLKPETINRELMLLNLESQRKSIRESKDNIRHSIRE